LKGYTLGEVEEWLHAFGNLPYGDLVSALVRPPTTEPVPAPASLVATSHQAVPASVVKKGVSFGTDAIVARKKRTYGMHFTGLPSERRGFNTTGSLAPPHMTAEHA
jgi:hypothetical protein